VFRASPCTDYYTQLFRRRQVKSGRRRRNSSRQKKGLGPFPIVITILAWVASVSLGLGNKERPMNGIFGVFTLA